MAQMLREFTGFSVWYQVDDLDRDPAVFLRHLIAGITHACGFERARARSRLGDVTEFSVEIESVLAVLIDELRENGDSPLMLCFDDFHLFDEFDHGSRIAEYLVRNLSENSQLVIATRNYPELSLGRLRTQGLILDVNDEDLQFSLDELSSLTDIWEIQASPAVLNKVHRSTEGWAAGLVLTENYLRSGSDMPDLFSQSRMQQNVYEYLAEEVLNNQPVEMQELLIKSALIDPVDPTICEKALGLAGTGKLLAEAEQRNLFTNRLDEAAMYRYHPLFRDFLNSRLLQQNEQEDINRIRNDYAKAFVDAGKEWKAIEQYLSAEKYSDAAALIEKAGDQMLNSAEYATLEKWIDSLPEIFITPTLQIQKAMILMSAGKFRKALNDLKKVKKLLNPSNLVMLSKSLIAECECLNELGNKHEAIEILKDHLLRCLSPELRLEVISQLAISYWISFDQHGIQLCCDMANSVLCEDDSIQKTCFTNIAEMQNMRQGIFQIAYKSLSKYCSRDGLSNSQQYFYENNLASCLMMLGKYDEALRLALLCEDGIKKRHELKLLPSILDTLGCIHIANGEAKKGKQLLEEALEVSLRIDQKRSDVTADSLCHLGTLSRRQGNPSEALKFHKSSLSEALLTDELYEVAMSNANIAADLLRLYKFDEAEEYFNTAKCYAKKYGLNYVNTQIDFSRAWASYTNSDELKMKYYLTRALQRADKFQHNHYIIQEGRISLPLFTAALEIGIKSDYVFWILEQIGQGSLDSIEPLLKHDDKIIREKIAKLLCGIGSTGALALLRRMRHDSEVSVQEIVRKSLYKLRKNLKSPSDLLTMREVEVLEKLSLGLTNNQIAQMLYISERTVKTHVVKIFRKMGFTNRLDAALYFQKQAEKDTTFLD
ncbi:MAG: LuxR C-terminal-related transcriptional regulator [Thermoleophilia bacterium]|nr:LuxR C-terminal-related transcriptional regulator [Thermoleophilia bacterium]